MANKKKKSEKLTLNPKVTRVEYLMYLVKITERAMGHAAYEKVMSGQLERLKAELNSLKK